MTANLGVAPDHRTRARGDEPASPSEDMQTDLATRVRGDEPACSPSEANSSTGYPRMRG